MDAKGYQALDYLLHQPGMTNEDCVTYFISNANAMNYLTDVVNNISYWSNYILTEWTSSYKDSFKSIVIAKVMHKEALLVTLSIVCVVSL